MKENFISGVHNYCDRWCERCRFVDRCQVSSNEKLLNLEIQMALTDSEEEKMKMTMQHVADTFAELRTMLDAMIKEQGLDWDEIMATEYIKPEPTVSQKKLEERGMRYIKAVDAFFEKHADYFEPDNITRKLLTSPTDPDELGEKVKTALEVIRWFTMFITVKINRAWNGKQEDPLFEDCDPVQMDFNGSAKVALLAIQESMESWEVLRHTFVELEDDMLDILALLDGTKKGVEREFPDAYKFVRPGFDEGM